MAAYIAERFDSRALADGDSPRFDLLFVIRDTDDEQEALGLVQSAAPASYENLDLANISVEPQGGQVWFGSARYELEDLGGDYEFDTSGGSQRLATSLATLSRVALPGYTAPDYGGAINVDGDRVEGVDITIPVFSFSETRYVPRSFLSDTRRQQLFRLTGRVNDDEWKGFAKGEVLFLGASGQRRGSERWTVTYKFAASPNVVNEPLGDGGLLVTKEGWEHVWVRFENDVNSNRLVKIPVAFYVERVYPYGDFDNLGI